MANILEFQTGNMVTVQIIEPDRSTVYTEFAGQVKSWRPEESAMMIDTTAMGQTYRGRTSGVLDVRGTLVLMYDDATTYPTFNAGIFGTALEMLRAGCQIGVKTSPASLIGSPDPSLGYHNLGCETASWTVTPDQLVLITMQLLMVSGTAADVARDLNIA